MKTRLGIAVAIVAAALIGAYILWGGASEKSVAAGSPAPAPAPAARARPLPGEVETVEVVSETPSASFSLFKTGKGWIFPSRGRAPADAVKVERLLTVLLQAGRDAAPDEAAPGETGGTWVVMGGGGREYTVAVGLRPDGIYDATYARDDTGPIRIHGDVRALLGMWRNLPDAVPDAAALAERRVFRFDPSQAVKIVATYPDHILSFARNADGSWRNELRSPGGDWSREGLALWLEELSTLQVGSSLVDGEAGQDRPEPTHTLAVTLADGAEMSLLITPDHRDEGVVVWSSEHPELAFHLPEWRFARYFNRLGSLFPDAVPHYSMDEIQNIDIRRGGENIKLVRRDGRWRSLALPYAPRQERVERLARLLASWRPVDYADPDGKNLRLVYGGPMIEVVLSDGSAYQYRLSGRHALHPWRYVTLDAGQTFSVSDAAAAAMFPGFSDMLDLGTVFGQMEGDQVTEMRLEDGEAGLVAALRRDADGDWTVSTDGGTLEIDRHEGERLAGELTGWPVAGFLPSLSQKRDAAYRLEVSWRDGRDAITILESDERDPVYLNERGEAFFLDRSDFFNWVATVKNIVSRTGEQSVDGGDAAETESEAQPESTPEREEQDSADGVSETPVPEPDTADPIAVEEMVVIGYPEAEPESTREREEEDSADGVSEKSVPEPDTADPIAVEEMVVIGEPEPEQNGQAGSEPSRIVPETVGYYGRVGDLEH